MNAHCTPYASINAASACNLHEANFTAAARCTRDAFILREDARPTIKTPAWTADACNEQCPLAAARPRQAHASP